MTRPRDDWEQRPFLHGLAVGYGMPLLVVFLPFMTGSLDSLLSHGQLYWLIPVFAAFMVPAYLLMRWLYPHYAGRSKGESFPQGCLLGGWLAGALLLWVSAPDRPFWNRGLIAVFGGVLLCGFWPWIGSLLSFAVQQTDSERRAEPGANVEAAGGPR